MRKHTKAGLVLLMAGMMMAGSVTSAFADTEATAATSGVIVRSPFGLSECSSVQQTLISVQQEIIFGTRIYVQILVLQGFVELSDVVKSGGIYSVRNAFATRLQQKYLKNIGHFSVIDTGECPFCYADFVSAVTLSSFSKVLLIASTRTCISK